jgi:hypothetical protein
MQIIMNDNMTYEWRCVRVVGAACDKWLKERGQEIGSRTLKRRKGRREAKK